MKRVAKHIPVNQLSILNLKCVKRSAFDEKSSMQSLHCKLFEFETQTENRDEVLQPALLGVRCAE